MEPERAPEPPWRALLESRSLPKEPLGHSPEPNQAQATSSRPPASLHRLRVFLALEADSDRLLGAALAADVAAVWPQAVRRLVLVSPLGLFDAADPSADIFAQPTGGLGALLCHDPAAFDAHVALPAGADPVEWTVQQVRAQEAAARLLWPVGDTRLARRLPRISQPTLLVFGGDDRVLPSGYRRRFQDALPQARLELVAGAGHLVDLDAPHSLARLVEGFLRS